MTLRLGITGGIGSGKSYVAHEIAARGIPVYDCDREAKRLIAEDKEIQRRLQALTHDLPRYLFASDANAARVARIVHPAVRRDFEQWCHRHADMPLVALESAILYESGFDTTVDRVLYIDAPLPLRIERAMERDHATRDAVLLRIARQCSDEARARADYRLINDGRPVAPQLQAILNTIL